MINIVLLIMDNGQRQVGLALAAVHLQNVQVDGDIVRVIVALKAASLTFIYNVYRNLVSVVIIAILFAFLIKYKLLNKYNESMKN